MMAAEYADEKPNKYTDGEETAARAAEEGHVATDESVLLTPKSYSVFSH